MQRARKGRLPGALQSTVYLDKERKTAGGVPCASWRSQPVCRPRQGKGEEGESARGSAARPRGAVETGRPSTEERKAMKKRQRNRNLRKLCTCKRSSWSTCSHPWHFNYKPRVGPLVGTAFR